MSVREPNSTGSTPRSRYAYSGVSRGPAWSARAFVAIILAIVAWRSSSGSPSAGKSYDAGGWSSGQRESADTLHGTLGNRMGSCSAPSGSVMIALCD